MLLRDHIGAPARPLLLHQANIPDQRPPQQPTKGNQEQSNGKMILRTTWEMGNMKPNLKSQASIFCIYLSLKNATCNSFFGDQVTDSAVAGHWHWCEGSVGEISFLSDSTLVGITLAPTIPHDRVFILLLPGCHTQLDGRSNSMWGRKYNPRPCFLFKCHRVCSYENENLDFKYNFRTLV